MSLVSDLNAQMTLPVIGAPLFIISSPDLVIAQCLNGVIGAFPALNARPADKLIEWRDRITEELAAAREADPSRKVAPFAVNQIVWQGIKGGAWGCHPIKIKELQIRTSPSRPPICPICPKCPKSWERLGARWERFLPA